MSIFGSRGTPPVEPTNPESIMRAYLRFDVRIFWFDGEEGDGWWTNSSLIGFDLVGDLVLVLDHPERSVDHCRVALGRHLPIDY